MRLSLYNLGGGNTIEESDAWSCEGGTRGGQIDLVIFGVDAFLVGVARCLVGGQCAWLGILLACLRVLGAGYSNG